MEDALPHKKRIPRDAKPFNDRLFVARCEALEATSQDLQAELVGMTQPSVSRMRSSKQLPRVDTALKIAKALGLTVEELWQVAS